MKSVPANVKLYFKRPSCLHALRLSPSEGRGQALLVLVHPAQDLPGADAQQPFAEQKCPQQGKGEEKGVSLLR